MDEILWDPLPDGGLFDEWARAKMSASAGGRRFKPESALAYSFTWRRWLQECAQTGIPWREATPQTIQAFLAGLTSAKRLRVAGADGTVTTEAPEATRVTRARYGRALQDIYDFATLRGDVKSNPVRKVLKERGESVVLSPQLWSRLVRALPSPSECTDWIAMRDTTILHMFLHAGLTVSEVQAMTVSDVSHARLAPGDPIKWLAPGLSLVRSDAVMLHIDGNRESQNRTLAAEPVLAATLVDWLEVRLTRVNQDGPRPGSPLFPSRKGLAPVTAKTLFLIASEHIRKALGDDFIDEVGNLELRHAGPTTLRNACIARWLSSRIEPGLVAQWAGLKDTVSLTRVKLEDAVQ